MYIGQAFKDIIRSKTIWSLVWCCCGCFCCHCCKNILQTKLNFAVEKSLVLVVWQHYCWMVSLLSNIILSFSVVYLHKPSTIHIFNQITNNIQMAQAFNASSDKTWVQGETTSFQLKALVQFLFKLSLSMNPISHSLSMHPTSVGTSVLDAILYLYLGKPSFKK